ncbi:MAG: NAD(P)-dependent oxidoreductase [SAR202 cluster bacterium]|nr:NAD(P)-dependent oxidoreductase [SAR202 cluster bacterium]
MRVLIAGAAGTIGTVLTKGLKDRHHVRGLDLRPMPLLEDTVVGSITDWDTVSKATQGMDAVIHLTTLGYEFEQAMGSITGSYNVFESGRLNGVKAIAFASRAGLFPGSRIPKTIQRTADTLWSPDSFYTISKVVGEGFGDMYASRYGISVDSVRIGGIDPVEPETPNHPHRLTHGDCVRVFEAAINHRKGTHERSFGVSDGGNWQLYDMEHGRKAIGYHPQSVAVVPPDKIGK